MAECVTAKYTARSDGNIDVYNRGWYWYYFFSYTTANGQAKCDDRGRCVVAFPDLFGNYSFTNLDGSSKPYNYNVLITDYISFSVVYTCLDGWFWNNQYLYILAREPTITNTKYQEIKAAVQNIVPDYDFTWGVFTNQ